MQIINDRRALHQIPELDMDLPETMAYLEKQLAGLNCKVFSPCKSSLCAYFDFGQDHAIAFRTDCDALPIHEQSGAAYASRHPGCAHACGHDGHMAMMLELARRLSARESLPHNALLIFQPAEEGIGGAKPICDSGIFETYNVKAIFGVHLWPGLEKGRVFCRPNELMAKASEITIEITGKSAHIAKSHEGLDATAAMMTIYARAAQVEADFAHTYRLLKFGQLHSGTVRNAISAHARMEGCLRAFHDEVSDTMVARMHQICRDVAEETGCTVDMHLSEGCPAVMNPPELYRQVHAIHPLEELVEPAMTAEDFGWYQRFVPGLFCFLGLGDTPALHSTNFDFDDSVLVRGADFFEELAVNFQ